mgnify:CR=1 FL=1
MAETIKCDCGCGKEAGTFRNARPDCPKTIGNYASLTCWEKHRKRIAENESIESHVPDIHFDFG